MSIAAMPKTWTAEVLTYTDLNAAFAHLRNGVNSGCLFLADASQTVSATVTFSASQTFSAGIALTGTLTMATAASKIVPGATSFSIRNNADSADNLILTDAGAATFRSTVGGITTLTCTTVTATNLGGTLTTAAQANVTSVGTLTALGIAGNLTFSGASRKIIPGTTDMTIRNVGDTADAFKAVSNAAYLGAGNGTTLHSVVGGSIATNGTGGHVYITYCAGVATGVPSIGSGHAVIYDNVNKKLGVYDGGWLWTAALT